MDVLSIELDCAPGDPRPGDLLPGVLEGTGVVLDVEKCSRCFGNWEWIIPPDQHEAYKKAQPIIKERIEKLYNHGTIRYGSW